MDAVEKKSGYKTFVLDEDEYYGLHKYIPKVSEEELKDSSGFANPETREAYVLRNSCKEFEEETIVNECSEFLNEHSSSEGKQDIIWANKKSSHMSDLKVFSPSQRGKIKELAQLDISEIAQQAHVSTEDAQIFKDFILKQE